MEIDLPKWGIVLKIIACIIEVENYLFASSEVRLANIELDKFLMLNCINFNTPSVENSEMLKSIQDSLSSMDANVDRLEYLTKVLSDLKIHTYRVSDGEYTNFILAQGYYNKEIKRCKLKANGDLVAKPNMRAGHYVK